MGKNNAAVLQKDDPKHISDNSIVPSKSENLNNHITLIKAQNGNLCKTAKTNQEGKVTISCEKFPKEIESDTEYVENLKQLEDELIEGLSHNDMSLALGTPKKRRTTMRRTQSNFDDSPSQWFFIDFDNGPENIEALIKNFPNPLQRADLIVCRTSSHRINNKFCYRLVYHLDIPLDLKTQKRIAKGIGADTSIYSPGHIVFSALPLGETPSFPVGEERVELIKADPPCEYVITDELMASLPPMDKALMPAAPIRRETNHTPSARFLNTLDKACKEIETAVEGERNNTLNKKAYGVASIAAFDNLSGNHIEEARTRLSCSAKKCGLDDDEIENTLSSAFQAGEQNPVPPQIILNSELHRIVDESIQAMAAKGGIYQRSGWLVRLISIAEVDASTFRDEDKGRLTIREHSPSSLRIVLSIICQYVRYESRSKTFIPKAPPNDVAAAILDKGEYPGIPVIEGITVSPFLRKDGTICCTPGFDIASGNFYRPSEVFPDIPEYPTQQDAQSALRELLDVFVDFPFTDEASRMVPIAGLLSILARLMFGNTPAFIADASRRGSGKTLLWDVLSIIATGRVMPKVTWPNDDTELEKILSAVALDPVAAVSFDNLGRKVFGGAALDKVLTASGLIKFRILGKTETRELKWLAIIFATDNNAQLKTDTARRTLISRMEPNTDRPEDRTGFKHPNLLGWVRDNRPRLVCAGLTLLRAWVCAGRPDMGLKPLGSFEEWSMTIPPAILFAGGSDVRQAIPKESVDDDGDTAASIFTTLSKDFPKGFFVRDLTEEGTVISQGKYKSLFDEVLPPHLDSARNRTIGNWLSKTKGRVVGGLKLTQSGKVKGSQRWRIESISHTCPG